MDIKKRKMELENKLEETFSNTLDRIEKQLEEKGLTGEQEISLVQLGAFVGSFQIWENNYEDEIFLRKFWPDEKIQEVLRIGIKGVLIKVYEGMEIQTLNICLWDGQYNASFSLVCLDD